MYRAAEGAGRAGRGARGGRACAGSGGTARGSPAAPAARSGPGIAGPPLGCRCRPPTAMVHAGPAARAPSRAMFAAAETKPRRAVSPLGIPKSPSFHSGLDLVANQTTKRSESVSDVARAFRFALFGDGSGPDSGMEGQGPPQQKVPSPPGARSPPPPPPTAPAPAAGAPPSDRPPLLNDKESLMVQLPLLKGLSLSVSPF